MAGILLASRLSSDPNVFVLLLEAGEQMPWFAHSPYFRYLFDSNEISYGWNVTLSSYNNEVRACPSSLTHFPKILQRTRPRGEWYTLIYV